ncbi:MAG: hypothetical protein ACXWC9_08960 [Pseudobdellovibrionaceae bacterium]
MKQLSILSLITALSSSAFAYRDGSFSCKNIQDLPNNSYKITSVAIAGAGSVKAPYLEVNRFYLSSGAIAEVKHVQVSGFPTVVKSQDSDLLILGGIELEFQNGDLKNCQK